MDLWLRVNRLIIGSILIQNAFFSKTHTQKECLFHICTKAHYGLVRLLRVLRTWRGIPGIHPLFLVCSAMSNGSVQVDTSQRQVTVMEHLLISLMMLSDRTSEPLDSAADSTLNMKGWAHMGGINILLWRSTFLLPRTSSQHELDIWTPCYSRYCPCKWFYVRQTFHRTEPTEEMENLVGSSMQFVLISVRDSWYFMTW